MKTKQKKQSDLEAITENFNNSSAAMFLSFTKLTVEKDQEFRSEIRATGAKYGVIKNTLARLAVKGTPYEDATEHFNGVTSVAWANGEPIDLSKVISKYVKADKGIFEFKTGIVDGKVIAFSDVEKIASLPSREELIGKLLYLINAPAQRLATVLSAIPRDLAAVVKQVSERSDHPAAAEAPKEETPKEEAPKEEAKQADAPKDEAPKEEAPKEEAKQADAPKTEAPKEEAPKEEAKQADAPKDEAPKEEAPKAEAPKEEAKQADAAKGEANAPADGKNKDTESSKKEDKSVEDDAAAEKGEADKESDSEQEGGDEPAGDESK